jgi:hypothetical protein
VADLIMSLSAGKDSFISQRVRTDYHLENSNVKAGGSITGGPMTALKQLQTDTFYAKYRRLHFGY